MKKEIIGIVAEFNPFHTGHKKLIEIIKIENPGCLIIVAMSGQFVQRGDMSIYDKWHRAEVAIHYGVDLIIEIPPYFVLNNANIFANKAISILYKFGVSTIYFGSENLSIDEMIIIAKKTNSSQNELKKLQNTLHSLPKAFENLIGKKINPNDTLGICYIMYDLNKKLKLRFKRIQRISNNNYQSASIIRNEIISNVESINNLCFSKKIILIENFRDIIIGKIITSNSEIDIIKYLNKIFLENKELSIDKIIEKSSNLSFTKSRIKRELFKFILDLTGSDELLILGMSNNGKYILKKNEGYSFRHTQKNIDNYKVERFISINYKPSMTIRLSKMMNIYKK